MSAIFGERQFLYIREKTRMFRHAFQLTAYQYDLS